MSREPFAITTDRGQVVLEHVLSAYTTKESEQSRALPPDRFGSEYKEHGLVEPIYNPDALARLLEINTWHSRCVYTKAQDVAGLGWGLKPVSGKENPNETERETLNKLFTEGISGADTLEEMLTEAVVDWEAVGDLYLEVVREGNSADGVPALLSHLPSYTVRVHHKGNKFAQLRDARSKVRWFKRFGYAMDVNMETGEEVPLGMLDSSVRASEVIHINHYFARSDFYGLPPAVPAVGAIEGMRALRDYNISFFNNFGVPSYAVYITGEYDLGEKTDAVGDPDPNGEYPIVRQIKDHLNEIKNDPHAPMIIAIPSAQNATGEVTISFEKLAVEVKDSSFRLYRKDNRDEVIVAHGVPPYRIGIAETGNLGGSTAEDSTGVYKDSVLAPRKQKLASVITNKIIKDGFGFEDWSFWFEDLDTDDEIHDKDIATFMFQHGSMTPNDVIRNFGDRFGIAPVENVPGMDMHYLNWTPLESGVVAGDVTTAVKELHNRLLNIAIKDEAKQDVQNNRTEDDSGNRSFFDFFRKAKS
jgi:PBSX family phage portal protein